MIDLKLFKKEKRKKIAKHFRFSSSKMMFKFFLALDASWKMPAGLLDGNIYWLGDYRECMSTKNFHYCTMADILLFNTMVFIF